MSALRRRSSDEQGHKRVANAERRVAVGGWRRIAAALLFLAALSLSTMGCDTVVGVGVGVSYPGPMYGPYPLIQMPGGPIVY